MYVKGADNVVLALLKSGQDKAKKNIEKHLENYAREGLRTLVIGEKLLTDEEYAQWNQVYKDALLSLNNREKLLEDAALQLEHSFELVGATAIEDKL